MDNGSNGNGCKSLASFIEVALRQAAEAHTRCCHSETEWQPFYARFLAHKLAPLLCAIQSHLDKELAVRLSAVVRGRWSDETIRQASQDREVSSFDGGPTWFLR